MVCCADFSAVTINLTFIKLSFAFLALNLNSPWRNVAAIIVATQRSKSANTRNDSNGSRSSVLRSQYLVDHRVQNPLRNANGSKSSMHRSQYFVDNKLHNLQTNVTFAQDANAT